MKNKIIILSTVLLLLSAACSSSAETQSETVPEGKTEVAEEAADAIAQDSIASPNKSLDLEEVYTDTVKYIAVDNDYDYWLLFAERGQDTLSLIYTEDYQFLKGDLLEITWKLGNFENAGDLEIEVISAFLISAKKL